MKLLKNIIAVVIIIFPVLGFAQKLDRSKLPKPGPAPILKMKEPFKKVLPNGITVLVMEDHQLPKVYSYLTIDIGSVTEGDKAGKLDLLDGLMSEGTLKRSKDEFDEMVDEIGAQINVSYSGGSASALTKYFPKAFALFAEGLLQPKLDEKDLADVRKKYLTGLKQQERNSKAIHSRVKGVQVWGKDHPKGEFTTEKTVNNVTLNDIKEAYKYYCSPNRAYLVFTGDITPAAAVALATKHLSSWKSSGLQLEKEKPVANADAIEIYVCDVPSSKQTSISAVNVNSLPKSSNDVYAASIANDILGGGGEGRLFLNLREKRGFTYGSYSSLGNGRNQTTFEAGAEVRHNVVDSAIEALIYEIKNMSATTVSAEDLQNTKNKYNGNFALGLQDNNTFVNYAINILTNNLPADYYKNYLKKLNAVKISDVQTVAQKYILADKLKIFATGKASEFKDKLPRLGYKIINIDHYGVPIVDKPEDFKAPPKQPVQLDPKTSGTSVAGILEKSIAALGKLEDVAAVKSIAMLGTLSFGPQSANFTMKRMLPNKEAVVIESNGMIFQKEVFDGTKGFSSGMGGEKQLEGDDLLEKKTNTSIFDEQNLITKLSLLTLDGSEKIDNKDCHKIKKVEGQKTTYYFFDKSTGLLIASRSKEEGPNGEMDITLIRQNYKAVNGVLIPHTYVNDLGQMQIEMVINKVTINSGVSENDFK